MPKVCRSLGCWLALLCAAVMFSAAADAEWVVGGYVGGAHTSDTSLHFQIPAAGTNLTIRPVSYADKPFSSPVYYGYRAGYYFKRYFGLEGEFTHLKVYADTATTAQINGTLHGAAFNQTAAISSIVQQFDITHGVNLLTGNLVGRKMFRTGRFPRSIVEARVGAGVTIPHPENEVLGVKNAQVYQVGSPVIQFAGGVEFHVWRMLYLLGEAKYTRVDETIDIPGGTATSALDSTHLVGGVAFHFF